MYFTKTDLKQIEDYINRNSIKDSEFPDANELAGSELISIVQNNENKKLRLKDFADSVGRMLNQQFINVTNDYFDGKPSTLQQAITAIPALKRMPGMLIAYLDFTSNDWKVMIFKGSATQFDNVTLWSDFLGSLSQQLVDSVDKKFTDITDSLKNIVYTNHANATISVTPSTIFKGEDTNVNVAWNASLSGLANPTITYTVLKGTDSFATEGTSKQDTVNTNTTYNLTAVIEGVTLNRSATVNAVYPIYAESINGDVTALPDNATKYSTPVTSANVTITYNPAETSYLYIFVPDGMAVSSAQLNSSAGNSPLPITKQPDINVDGKGVYHVYRSAMKQVAGSYNVTFKS